MQVKSVYQLVWYVVTIAASAVALAIVFRRRAVAMLLLGSVTGSNVARDSSIAMRQVSWVEEEAIPVLRMFDAPLTYCDHMNLSDVWDNPLTTVGSVYHGPAVALAQAYDSIHSPWVSRMDDDTVGEVRVHATLGEMIDDSIVNVSLGELGTGCKSVVGGLLARV